MNKFYLLFISLLTIVSSFAQKVDYDNDSRWFWTANAGATWTTADVKTNPFWGWGLTIGKSFGYNYNNPVSLDVRGRFLHGEWFGQNGDTTGFQYPNTALSSGNTNYKSAYGYSVLNHKTTVNEIALELVLHANNLRAATGWDLFVFGGIGYSWYNTRGDLLKGDSLYAYNQLGSFSKSSVSQLLDGSYESALDGTKSTTSYTGAWMPSVGIGLGYQVGPRFSIGVEHKITFTLADNFDGSVNPTSKIKNDWYHYTSLYLRFQIRDHAPVREDNPNPNTNTGGNSLNNVPNYDPANNNLLPTVTIKTPAASGLVVSTPNYVITADIRNVPSAGNVVFQQNGNYLSNFAYNPSTQAFSSNVQLVPGQNVFVITGTNNYGSDSKQTIIIYNREEQKPPVVTYVNPASSPVTVTTPQYNVVATVLNVTQQSQVNMTVNGAQVPFTFNPSNSVANGTINLQVGSNIVTTTGTNQYGTDQESVTIIYNPQQSVEQPPVVYFTNPNNTPYTTSSPSFNLMAEVINVAGSQNVTFKQNGVVNQNFTYNPQSDVFQSNVVLNPGQNVFEIIGSNSAGVASASTIIIYERQAPKPPVVTITNPSASPYETSSTPFALSATVLNVTVQSQVTVSLNGQPIPFSFNGANGGVSASLNLAEGSNTVTVTGTNNDGTDSKTVMIIYRKPVTQQPPIVTITNPNTTPYITSTAGFTVQATVLNVAQNGVTVNVNGALTTNFTFDPYTTLLTLPLNLIEGANVITITGTNAVGTDSKSTTIIYRKPVTIVPPIVTFIDPAVNPTTVFSQSYDLKARVQNVTSSQQITLKINGTISGSFVFTPSSETMTFTSGLVPGANVFEITATNAAGSDQKSTTIIYRAPDPVQPPVVTITNPAPNPYSVTTPTTPVAATVLNVESAQYITVNVNGTAVSSFTYNAATKQLNLVMNLVQGSNTIQVTGTNQAGSASDSRVILYRREQPPVPPLVSFTNPSAPGQTVAAPGYTVKGSALRVDDQQHLTLTQNGQTISPSLWSFNPGTKEVVFNTSLTEGNNVFTLTGTNAAGTNTASTTIIYTRPVVPCNRPVIAITSPMNNQQFDNVTQTVTAQISNVSSVNQVTVYVNGVIQTSGSLSGTTFTKQVTLSGEQNVIEIGAKNDCGEAKANVAVYYKPVSAPCLAPVLNRILPQTGALTVEVPTTSIQAVFANITAQNQLSVTLNGQPVAFSFDLPNHTVSANISLTTGNNVIAVVAQNECGNQTLTWNILKRDCNQPFATLISSTTPDNGTIATPDFAISYALNGVTAQNEVVLTVDGNAVGFVYNSATHVLSWNGQLTDGQHTLNLTMTTPCGTATIPFHVTKRKAETVRPPTARITAPASGSLVYSSTVTVQISTMNIAAASQAAVTVNGAPVNFNFVASTGQITLNAQMQNGTNMIVVTVANAAGTASDNCVVTYRPTAPVNQPTISLTSPVSCPAELQIGANVISGVVHNVGDPSSINIHFDNQPVQFTSTVSGTTVTFHFTLNVTRTTVNLPIVITATNTAGTATFSCNITHGALPATGTTGIKGGEIRPGIRGNTGNTGNTQPEPVRGTVTPIRVGGGRP